MKQILMLTNIFPIPKITMLNSTSVCYYFAKEWVKLGYKVIVYYNYSIYTPILHLLARFFGKKISNYFPTVINENRFDKMFSYELEGIQVVLLPCYKFIPKIPFPRKSINRQVLEIIQNNEQINFYPDVIVGHFLHPSLEIMYQLKDVYSARTALVLHGKIGLEYDIESIRKYHANIDLWGYRSLPIKESFEKEFGISEGSFMCFSGVPKEYITFDNSHKTIEGGVSRYIYVGNLIKRKHPLKVIQALYAVYGEKGFHLTVVGSGDEDEKMYKYINKKNIKNQVSFCGRLKRDDVIKELSHSECFIMISETETFGLVYLEAMANGCITIASKNEGMDGIIIDGYNGFLCKAGNVMDLSRIIAKVRAMNKEELENMSFNAINTALEMTNEKVAFNYLKSITE